MIVRYDTKQRVFSFDAIGARSWGADVRAVLDRHNETIPLAGVRFGLTVTVNGAVRASREWPDPDVEFVATDQDQIAVYRVRWAPDDLVAVYAWMDSPLGRVEGEHTFTAPRPAQPFPSWTWTTGAWTPPIPYPSSGGLYEWDESAQQWVAA